MRAKDFSGPIQRGGIVLADYFASISDALEGYRSLKLYIDNVFDEYHFELEEGYALKARLQHVGKNKAVTAAIVELMTDQMQTYKELCSLYGDVACRRYQVIYKKYFEFPGKGREQDHPYTNAELAEHFDVDVSTVRRDLNAARKELKLLFFGAQKH